MIPVIARRGRVSGTTYEPFNGRLVYHLLGSRPDPATRTLAGGLPATHAVVMRTMIHPLVWASKATGFVLSAFEYPPPRPTPFTARIGARCEFFDAIMREHRTADTQVVILGAGWDTRAYRLLEGRAVDVFEVDAPATQAVKRAAIAKTGLDAHHVVFMSCDFNCQSWLDALVEKGFDPTRRTFVLSEGVTVYLGEHAIASTLQSVAGLPLGSRIVFDFLKAQGLSLAEHRPMGDEEEGGLPFGGLVVATHTV